MLKTVTKRKYILTKYVLTPLIPSSEILTKTAPILK